MDTVKMRTCSHLLPDPGGEVVRELLDEVERLHAEISAIKAMHNGYDPEARKVMPSLKEPASLADAMRELKEEVEEMVRVEAKIDSKLLRLSFNVLAKQLKEMTLDRDMARKALAELQQTWAENAPAVQYKKERDEALAAMAEATKECGNYCPFCGVDPRPQKQCRSCENDHLGSTCMRNGKHKDDCVGLKAMKTAKSQSSPSVVA